LARALRAKAGILRSRGHVQESTALLTRSLELALEHDVATEISTNYYWLSDRCFQRDAYAEALGLLEQALAHTRRIGSRPQEWAVLAEQTYPLMMLGRWDESRARGSEFTQEQIDGGGTMLSSLESSVEIDLQRGDLEGARRSLQMFARIEHSADRQEQSAYLGARAALRRAEGRLNEALADAELTIEVSSTFGLDSQGGKQGVCEALEAAFALGDSAKVEQLIGSIVAFPPGTRPPFLDAQARRFRAKLAADPRGLAAAAARFRDLELPFHLAVALLEQAELAPPAEAEPLLAEATEIFERLGATPWIERARRAATADALVS
jgi:tetratricopeptide (TPR) repeat protein